MLKLVILSSVMLKHASNCGVYKSMSVLGSSLARIEKTDIPLPAI